MRFTLLAFLLLITASGVAQTGSQRVELTLSISDSIQQLPKKGEDDWFDVEMICTLTNHTADTVYFVDPKAYRVYPHPWNISINGNVAHLWEGDFRCAPLFTEEDIIALAPGASIEQSFSWHTFVGNFTKEPGIYNARVSYRFAKSSTAISNSVIKKMILSDLETDYSNTIQFRIVK